MIEENLNEQIHYVHELENSLLMSQFSQNWSVDSVQSQFQRRTNLDTNYFISTLTRKQKYQGSELLVKR